MAPKLAASISEREGFALGRSSHRLRNSESAQVEPIRAYLERYAKAGEQAPVEASHDDRSWVVIAPIVTPPLCLTCHGDPATFSPELKQALKESYPDDRATGFSAGDLRGVFWARIP